MTELEHTLSMHLAGTAKTVEQVGLGVATFMSDDGVTSLEKMSIVVKYWDMAEWSQDGPPIPNPFPVEECHQMVFVLQDHVVRDLFLLLYESREDLARLGIISDDETLERG